jgi:hypothetical protein
MTQQFYSYVYTQENGKINGSDKDVDEYVHSSITRDSQKVEVTQMPTT